MFRKICDGLKSFRSRALFGSKCTVFKTVPFPEFFPSGLNLALKGPVMAMRRASGSILGAWGFFRQFRRRQTELLFSGSSTAFDVNLESIFKQSPFAGIVLFFCFYAHAASAVDMMRLLEFFQLQSGKVLALVLHFLEHLFNLPHGKCQDLFIMSWRFR